MHRFYIISSLILLGINIFSPQTATREQALPAAEQISGSVVCAPGVYSVAPSDCLPLGPSTTIAQFLSEGLPYPIVPLPAYKPDNSLNDTPYSYYKVSDAGTKLYPSLDAVAAHQASIVLLPSNDIYLSYTGAAVTVGDTAYYPLRSGAWVPIASQGGRLAPFDPPFQGLVFSSTPRNSFGWVLGTTVSHVSPGISTPETGSTWYRFQVVQIYSVQQADGLSWYMIGPNEWLDARNVSRVDLETVPPKGVPVSRWIEVNLEEQTLTVYAGDQLVFATLASTGVDRFWTRPGVFQIHKKLDSTTMSNSIPDEFYYLEDVPWTMYFDEDRALHGAYWHNGFGYPHSHGCVNLSVGDAHWLYNWASVGDYVYVYDPSGRTPTDPSLYGTGAP